MSERYYSLEELLELIVEPNKSCCKQIYADNRAMFETAK
jgi:hypothetical protein